MRGRSASPLAKHDSPWLAAQQRKLDSDADTALHVRAGEFTLEANCRSNCRGLVGLDDYLNVLTAVDARRVAVASDVPSTAGRLRALAASSATGLSFVSRPSHLLGSAKSQSLR